MRKLPLLAVVAAVLSLVSCAVPGPSTDEAAGPDADAAEPDTEAAGVTSEAGAFAAAVDAAHGREAWQSREAFAADITMGRGGEVSFRARMTLTPSMSRTRMDLPDGTVGVFDGQDAWVAPADSEFVGQARFQLLTWPYFLAAPFKLRDPGTDLEVRGTEEVMGQEHEAARLTFEPGTGDTPDDWYLVYKDPETDFVQALGFIVTYGKSVDEAEETPELIVYDDYTEVDGVQIPMRWTIYLWSPETGVEGDPIAEVTLSNAGFLQPEDGFFDPPEGAVAAEAPGAG